MQIQSNPRERTFFIEHFTEMVFEKQQRVAAAIREWKRIKGKFFRNSQIFEVSGYYHKNCNQIKSNTRTISRILLVFFGWFAGKKETFRDS
jgi:hypothetical protein